MGVPQGMALLSISAAARVAGKDRETIRRYLKSGKLNATTDAIGRAAVDTAELLRVFGELQTSGDVVVDSSTMQHAEKRQHAADVAAILQQELQSAREREEWLRRQNETLQEQLGAALAHNRALELKMLPSGALEEKGFWARIFGGGKDKK
jgi:predicted site-specific integrase-resolvase